MVLVGAVIDAKGTHASEEECASVARVCPLSQIDTKAPRRPANGATSALGVVLPARPGAAHGDGIAVAG